MADKPQKTINVSIRDDSLIPFIREQARLFYGGNVSAYLLALVKLDRERGVVRDEIGRRLAALAAEREEGVA